MKVAVYIATSNYYEKIIPSVKSFLKNTNVDKIYILAEDDEMPFYLPPECEVMNMSNQSWFKKWGPNYNSHWSWMILLRGAYPYIFSDEDVILSLDCDTLAMDGADDIWDVDLDDYYFAAVKEPRKSKMLGYTYGCIGVALMNLKMLRDTNMVEKIVRSLNREVWGFPEQDCYNSLCRNRVKDLGVLYGAHGGTDPLPEGVTPKIYHFAATGGRWWNYDIVQEYLRMPWSDVRKEYKNADIDSSSDI